MMDHEQEPEHNGNPARSINAKLASCWILITTFSFTLGQQYDLTIPLLILYPIGLLELSSLRSTKTAFYAGFVVGTIGFGLQLRFFWAIFGPAAVFLWMVLGFWIGLFVLLSRQFRVHFGEKISLAGIPIIWLGLEYIRCELYPLKFSWLTLGSRFIEQGPAWFAPFGNYGIGAGLCLIAAWIIQRERRWRVVHAGLSIALLATLFTTKPSSATGRLNTESACRMGGIQLEFPIEAEILDELTRFKGSNPEIELIVLSEYSLQSPPSKALKKWCRDNQQYLIIGGKDPIEGKEYFNTAFVISPAGEIVFKQGKSEPIQFFSDGRPAPSQNVWHSPWGRIGIAVCYDLSFTRVIDKLIRQGAEALIIPTMDVTDWGRREHELHARIAPVRAREYQVPIFRIASSGISQSVDHQGSIRQSALYPGQGECLSDTVIFSQKGRLPWDRSFAPAASGLTFLYACWLLFCQTLGRRSPKTVQLSSRNPEP